MRKLLARTRVRTKPAGVTVTGGCRGRGDGEDAWVIRKHAEVLKKGAISAMRAIPLARGPDLNGWGGLMMSKTKSGIYS